MEPDGVQMNEKRKMYNNCRESIQFQILSSYDINRLSLKNIFQSTMYNKDTLEPSANGPLDMALV